MACGMPYRDFWKCSWTEYFAYLRAFQISSERMAMEADSIAWWQGHYTAAAMMSVYPLFNGLADPRKSPKYPYPRQPLSTEKRRTEEEREKFSETVSAIQAHNLRMRAIVNQSTKNPPDK